MTLAEASDAPLAVPVPADGADRDAQVSAATALRIAAATAVNTTRAYKRQWKAFTAWCAACGRSPLPATDATLAEYASVMVDAGAGPASIEQAIATVRRRHRDAGLAGQPDTRAARLVLRTHRRTRAEAGHQARQAPPAIVAALRAMADQTDPTTPIGLRDRLLLTLGFAMMARRSELVTLALPDVTEVDEGLLVRVRTSKTDPDAVGATVPVIYASDPGMCPVRLCRDWRTLLTEHHIVDGPLLRSVTRHGRIGLGLSGDGARRIIRRLAIAAGLPDAQMFSAHSLRAGAATAAAKNGAPVNAIALQGRWSPGSPVVHGYIRAADQWRDHPLRGVL